MFYIALAAIVAGLVLCDRLCPKIQVSGPPYSWSTTLRALTLTSGALVAWGMVGVSVFPVIR